MDFEIELEELEKMKFDLEQVKSILKEISQLFEIDVSFQDIDEFEQTLQEKLLFQENKFLSFAEETINSFLIHKESELVLKLFLTLSNIHSRVSDFFEKKELDKVLIDYVGHNNFVCSESNQVMYTDYLFSFLYYKYKEIIVERDLNRLIEGVTNEEIIINSKFKESVFNTLFRTYHHELEFSTEEKRIINENLGLTL